MTQELFWIVSTINFIAVIIMTIINMVISIVTAEKMRELNKRIGIDLSMHKELMNSINEFLLSIEYSKVNFPVSMEKNEDFLTIINCNNSNMRSKYVKLTLYIQYSYTDNKEFKQSLDNIYYKYCNVFEYLFEGIHSKQLYYRLAEEQNRERYQGILHKAIEALNQYRNILDNKDVDDVFFEQLNLFIKEETNFIKHRK